MIKSITFHEGKGYVSEHIEKPTHPKDNSRLMNRFRKVRSYLSMKEQGYHSFGGPSDEDLKTYTQEYYNKLVAEYKEKMKWYRKHKNDYVNDLCAKCLLNRKFEFSGDKINVIFGPNASGKSTILHAIAESLCIDDGFTRIFEPLELSSGAFCEKDEYSVSKYIERHTKNCFDLEWDGVPVYFENFQSRSGLRVGDLQGSILKDASEEITYLYNRNKISLGQKSMFIMNKVLGIAAHPVTYSMLMEQPEAWIKSKNEVWAECAKSQIDYWNSFPKANSGEPNTVMFDEMDKSLDIVNTAILYSDYLPKIREKYGMQFILVSHSPIILTDKIFNSPNYNIISMDKEYTDQCRETIKKLL